MFGTYSPLTLLSIFRLLHAFDFILQEPKEKDSLF
mgnify:CR=1 FL=1